MLTLSSGEGKRRPVPRCGAVSLGGSPATSEVVTWQIYRLGFNCRSTADKRDRPDVCNLTSPRRLRNIAWNSDGGTAIAYVQVRMKLLANLHSPPFPAESVDSQRAPYFFTHRGSGRRSPKGARSAKISDPPEREEG